MKALRIAIGVHGTDSVPTIVYLNHVTQAAAWVRKMPDVEFTFIGTARVKNADARNIITRNAVEAGCTHWLSLDTDHLFRDDFLPLLWGSRDAAMVSGLVTKRAYPFEPVAFRFDPTTPVGTTPRYMGVMLLPFSGLVSVDGCAFGCTLVNLEKLQKLPRPWFYDDRVGRSDLNLCRAFRAVGERLLIDTRAAVGHLGDPTIVWPDTADDARQEVLRCSK